MMTDSISSPHDTRMSRIRSFGWDAGYGIAMAASAAGPLMVDGVYGKVAGVASLAAGIGCLVKKTRHQVKAESPILDIASLDNALMMLHTLVLHSKKCHHPPQHRICVFWRDPKDPTFVNRITSNVGEADHADEPSRIHELDGLVGFVAQSGQTVIASLPSGENLASFLVSSCHCSTDIAAKVRRDRKSWYGVPLSGSGPAKGVLFCDSSNASFFETETSVRCKLLRTARIPIAEIIKKAYPHNRE